jgi:hypothetical protein
MDLGHWCLCGVSGLSDDNMIDYLGFVYVITRKDTGRKYIGQKKFWKTTSRPPLKGRVNKRRKTVESDWRTYTGSSKSLNLDIEALGKDNFIFEIIALCASKWEMTYTEYKKIIDEDAILRESYYNEFLGRVGKAPNSLKKP